MYAGGFLLGVVVFLIVCVRVSLDLRNICCCCCCCFKKHFMWNLSTNWNSWHSSKVVFQLVYSIMNSIQKVFGGDICLSRGSHRKMIDIWWSLFGKSSKNFPLNCQNVTTPKEEWMCMPTPSIWMCGRMCFWIAGKIIFCWAQVYILPKYIQSTSHRM